MFFLNPLLPPHAVADRTQFPFGRSAHFSRIWLTASSLLWQFCKEALSDLKWSDHSLYGLFFIWACSCSLSHEVLGTKYLYGMTVQFALV